MKVMHQMEELTSKSINAAILLEEGRRINTELQRVLDENNRLSAELIRISAENDRIAKDLIRESNETTRLSSEITRGENELIRDGHEVIRISNEDTRLSQESTRQENEVTRGGNEDTRIGNENIRIANEETRPDLINITWAEYLELPQEQKDSPKYFYRITDDDTTDPDNLYQLIDYIEGLRDESLTNKTDSGLSKDAAKRSEDNAELNHLLSKSYAVGISGNREGEEVDNSKYYKEVVAQAMADLLHMLGDSVATLDENGHLTADQIPALSINTVDEVVSTDAMLLLTAQRGDVALIIPDTVVTESYILSTDNPTVLANWKKLGVSYVANAGHAVSADTAANSDKINNKRLISMTQSQYDVAVLDEDTYYIVVPD